MGRMIPHTGESFPKEKGWTEPVWEPQGSPRSPEMSIQGVDIDPEDIGRSALRGLTNVPVGLAALADLAVNADAPYFKPLGAAYNFAQGNELDAPTNMAGQMQSLFGDHATYVPKTGLGKGVSWGTEGAGSVLSPGGGGVALLRGAAKGFPLAAGTVASTLGGNAAIEGAQFMGVNNPWAVGGLSLGAAIVGGGGAGKLAGGLDANAAAASRIAEAQLPPSVRPGGPLRSRLQSVGGDLPTRPGDPGVNPQDIVKARERLAGGLLGREVPAIEFERARAAGDDSLLEALLHQQKLFDEAVEQLGEAGARQAAGEVVPTTVGVLGTSGDYGTGGFRIANLEKEFGEVGGFQQRLGSASDRAKKAADIRLDARRGAGVSDDAAAAIDETLVARVRDARIPYQSTAAYQNAPPIDGIALRAKVEAAYGSLSAGKQLALDPFELSIVERAMEKQGRFISIQDVDEMAMDLKAAQREALSGAEPNGKLAHALGKIISEVEDAIDGSIAKTVGMDDAPQLMEARAAFKKAINELDPPKPGTVATPAAKAAYAARAALRGKNGDSIIKSMMSPQHKARSEDVINRVKEIVGEGSEEWELIRSAAVRHLEKNSSLIDNSSGLTRRLKTLRQVGNSEGRAYRQILGDNEYEEVLDAMQLKRAATYSSSGQMKQASEPGSGRVREGIADSVTGGGGNVGRVAEVINKVTSVLPPSAADRLTAEALADPQIAHFLLSLTAEELESFVTSEGGINAMRAAARSAPGIGRRGRE